MNFGEGSAVSYDEGKREREGIREARVVRAHQILSHEALVYAGATTERRVTGESWTCIEQLKKDMNDSR